MSRNLRINETESLIALSSRHAIFYLEHAKLVKYEQDIRVLNRALANQSEVSLPVANIGGLILGPGCSVTSEAARVAAARGCLLLFAAGGGLPIYSASTQHRSPTKKLQQYEICSDETKRLKAARLMFVMRRDYIEKHSYIDLPKFPVANDYQSINAMLSAEGAWAKKAYRRRASYYDDTSWRGKAVESKSRDNPLSFLNFLAYSLADIAIIHLGLDPNIGILHGQRRGGGLVYDLADIFKPIIALDLSFKAMSEGWSVQQSKVEFLNLVHTEDILTRMIDSLKKIFPKNYSRESGSLG